MHSLPQNFLKSINLDDTLVFKLSVPSAVANTPAIVVSEMSPSSLTKSIARAPGHYARVIVLGSDIIVAQGHQPKTWNSFLCNV
ncbi:hypothetical protein DY000_02013790 [Brassica cretica]|uniref:Uncharacterized protein n=1 Tax=Brassica cretica TaxID=69181 RepID=A0ABQ7DD58_BRACR|nr:hypothetical protein DY000_02013790 [Brassica cretica]